ncbi:MAG: sigma factor [Micromonosporaceae bacterium]
MDPLTLVIVTASAQIAARYTGAHAEAEVLRARTELARAAADLPPGTVITGTGRGGERWTIHIPAAETLPPRPRPAPRTPAVRSVRMADRPAEARLTFPDVPPGRDPADLHRFWADWEPVIRRSARAKLRSARVPRALSDTDDAVQHAYAELSEHWSKPDFAEVDPGRFVLGRVLRDFIRAQVDELKKRRGQPGRHSEFDEDLGLPEPTAEDLFIEQEVDRLLLEALPQALAQLSENQRRALELSAQGLGREAIAAELNVKVGTVSSHFTRAKAKVHAELAAGLMAASVTGSIIEHLFRAGRGFSLAAAMRGITIGLCGILGIGSLITLIKFVRLLRRLAQQDDVGRCELLALWLCVLLPANARDRFAQEWCGELHDLRVQGVRRRTLYFYAAQLLWRLPALWWTLRTGRRPRG